MSSLPRLQPLCALDAIADGGSAAFSVTVPVGVEVEIFLVRRGARCFAYRNSCPHTGAPLDWVPGRFMDAEGRWIQCDTHYALFEVDTGLCVFGPCAGQSLQALPLREVDGVICLELPLT